jgi:B12-binding domain/radical SAM domain protein
MKVHWRSTHATRNTYAALSAACETQGFTLDPVTVPEKDVTCYSLNSRNERQLAPEIADADCITIAGGPYATACFREVARYADYVVVGEGEYTLPLLLAAIEEGAAHVPPGVATREGYRPAVSQVRLDAWPPFSQVKGYVEITRGCPFGCAYCQTPRIFGGAMRHRSIDQIARYASRFRDIRFVTPNALAYGSRGREPDLRKVRGLLQSLSGTIYFGTFPSEVRPEFISREAIALITTYCANTSIQFGAQSGSDAVLERLGRGHTVADVILAMEESLDAGLVPIVDMIVGFPFETDEDQYATGDLIRTIARRGKVHCHRFMPLPGTPLARDQPRHLVPGLAHLLGSLALRGRVTGSWSEPKIAFCGLPSHDRA